MAGIALLVAGVSVGLAQGARSDDVLSTPDRPTGLSVTSQTHDSVTLTWDDPGDSSILGYQVLRRSRDGSRYGDERGAPEFVVIVDDTGSSTTTYTDSSVRPRTRYVYRVQARSAQGLSVRSSYANAETPRLPPPPSAPQNLIANGVPPGRVELSWDDPQDSSITGYRILRRSRDGSRYGDGRGAPQFVVIVDDTGSSTTTYTDSSVRPRTRYVYRVQARSAGGLSTGSRSAHAEIRVPPSGPTGLALVAASDDGVTLAWDNPGDGTIEGYQVLRRQRDASEYGDGAGPAELVVVVDDTASQAMSYTDASVEAGTRYIYGVRARNSQGLSEVSAYLNAETPSETPQGSEQASRPNVVLILADDLGWGDVRSNNPDSSMITPRIDGIAASGVNFTDGHSPSSVCSPTRYGLLTGRYAWRSWLSRGTLSVHDRPLIGRDRATLGTLLQGQGYRTAAIGKWHLGMDFARLSDVDDVTEENRGIDFGAEIVDGPLDHGFDEFFGTSSNLTMGPPVYIRDRSFVANPDRGDQPDSGFYEYGDVLDRLSVEAVSFIERQAKTDAPFFLYLPLHTPHTPMVPNAQFDGLTGLGAYADVVAQMDWTVGRVLDALNRVGARENTLVIFTSDNGSFMGLIPVPNHVDHRTNGMWRDGKQSIYEGGHRVPLLMQWPRGIDAGSTVDATVSLTDLYATVADIVGEEPEDGVAPDSVSLLPLVRGDAGGRGAPVVHHSFNGMFAIRDGRWKLVFGDGNGTDGSGLYLPPSSGTHLGLPRQLYDLHENRDELRNVIRYRPDVVARMTELMRQVLSAEDGFLAGDASLRSLRVAGVDIGRFDSGVRTYAGTVDRRIETVRVTALPSVTDARVVITTPDGRRLYKTYSYGRHGHGQAHISLAEGSTTITVTVTAADDSATETYTVILTRVGLPTVRGTAQVGEMLTADTSGIADADGLANAVFSYQWLSSGGTVDTNIAGATDPTHTLTADEEGRTIKVRVSFTDDAGNEESLTSAATVTVVAAAEEVVWEGELTVGRQVDLVPKPAGYSVWGNLGGTLSPDRFEIDGRVYGVLFLVYFAESLWLGMDGVLPAEFTLQVGGSTYRGSESRVPATGSGDAAYWWPSAVPEWYSGGRVRASLSLEPQEPIGSRRRAPLIGNFRDIASGHDGRTPVTVGLMFSEEPEPGLSFMTLRDHALTVTGGTVIDARPQDPPGNTLWEITVRPRSNGPVTVTLPATTDCAAVGAICTGDGRGLFNRAEFTVPGPATSQEPQKHKLVSTPAALTASVHDAPESHSGQNPYIFELRFSEEPASDFSFKTLRDHAFTVTGGSVESARRLAPPGNVRWEIAVMPDGDGEITITLPATTDCEAAGAVCTGDGRMLSAAVTLTVAGPAGRG